MPAFASGVSAVRGRVVPVVDLKSRLGLPCDRPADRSNRIVIVQHDDQWVGDLVDSVSEVRVVADSAICADVPIVAALGGEIVDGIAELDDDLVILLSVVGILGQNAIAHAA